MKQISIHNLAVLRAVVEGQEELGVYFGSTAALDWWISSTCNHGLIDASGMATSLGTSMASQLNLSGQGAGRAYLWRHASELEKQAHSILNLKHRAKSTDN